MKTLEKAPTLSKKTLIFTIITITFSALSQAQTTVEFDVTKLGQNFANRSPEVCVIPSHFQGTNYEFEDSAREEKLCSVDFYGETYAACQKIVSTNPGLEVFEIPANMTRTEYQARNCTKLKGREGFRMGKFKQSVSCSYFPSILGTYHMARILGNILHVPTAVYRTMDTQVHKNIVSETLKLLSSDPTQVIYKTWYYWKRLYNDYTISKNKVFTNDLQQIMGALFNTPLENDHEYMEFHDEKSYDVFIKNPLFLQLNDNRTIEEITGSNKFEEVTQTILRMKDLSDVILLDSIMSQQDRIGNIDYLAKWYQFQNGEIIKTAVKETPEDETLMKSQGAIQVKEMLIQDSDCGLSDTFGNIFMQKAILETYVSHMSLNTYQAFMSFAKKISLPETKTFFQANAQFTDADFLRVATQTKRIQKILLNKCKNGQLHLDLNLEKILRNENIQNSQAYCE